MSEPRFYSLRRLSPYQGTVQVIEAAGFRAMSPDGITWQVQILNRVTSRVPGRSRSSTYGVWRADGSGDLIDTDRTRPFLDLLQNHPSLPFPLADRLELWLLDERDALPLALVASSFTNMSPPRHAETRWQAVIAGDTRFVSPSLAVQQAAGDAPQGPMSHGDLLARCVQDAAGATPRAQWFLRDAEGHGHGLSGTHLDAAHHDRHLSRDIFPELLVREHWKRDEAADLVRDYHAWHAAYLLTHDHLSQTTRGRLEQDACRQAESLYRLRYVLPEVVNPELLKVAMVEAVIRRANTPVT